MIYALFQLIIILLFSPSSIATKFPLGMLGLLGCIVFVVFVVIFIRHPPIPSSNIFVSFSPFPIGFLGLVQICFGSLSLSSLLDALPAVLRVADTPWKLYMTVAGAFMLPVGLLVFIFSSLQLILNRKSK